MDALEYSLRLKTDDELNTILGRSQLDVSWLAAMADKVPPNSGAAAHYRRELKKEQKYLDTLEKEMDKRGLFEDE